jgi:GTP cyclohydrolase I
MLNSQKRTEAEYHVKCLLQLLGQAERLKTDSMRDTPKRMVKYLEDFCSPKPFKFTTFDAEGCSEMVTQVNIPFVSLCEHHTLPFYGVAVVGYIPSNKIVGLSKLARAVQFFARRLQNQERITKQVAEFIQKELSPNGVGVHLRAEHLCMTIRGVAAHGAKTNTVCLLGAMKNDSATRAEFLSQVPP